MQSDFFHCYAPLYTIDDYLAQDFAIQEMNCFVIIVGKVWKNIIKNDARLANVWYCYHGEWHDKYIQVISHLTLKWLGHFFSKCDFIFWWWSPYVQHFYMKLVQYNECLVSIVDIDGLVL